MALLEDIAWLNALLLCIAVGMGVTVYRLPTLGVVQDSTPHRAQEATFKGTLLSWKWPQKLNRWLRLHLPHSLIMAAKELSVSLLLKWAPATFLLKQALLPRNRNTVN